MQKRRGFIYPRIAEEVVDYQELQDLWGCSYLTAYRILYGHAHPNHKRKKALSDYLGIPIDVLWAKVEPRANEATTPKNSETISESDKGV